jgi:hypothetical protein
VPHSPGGGGEPASIPREHPETERWFRVEVTADRFDCPPLPASLGRPFAVGRPEELCDLIAALADRPATSAGRRVLTNNVDVLRGRS